MDILGYKTSEVIDLIYQEILSLNPSIKIEWAEVKDIKDSRDATGSCLVNHETGNAKICLTAEGKIDEDAISHEMLHALWFTKGYIDAQPIPGCRFNESITAISINNYIQHTFILKRQLALGILNDIVLKSRLTASYNLAAKNSSNIGFNYLIYVVICFGADLISRKIYGMQMPSDSLEPIEIYNASKRLTDLIEKYDLTTPLGQRRALVTAYKGLERIAQEKGIRLDTYA